MRKSITLTGMIVLLAFSVCAQTGIPIIKASNPMVSIRDGGILSKNSWTITPKLKPDVYTTTHKNTRVTFFTDLDSITFKVKQGGQYDFNILLNNDTAWTRIKFEPGSPYLSILKKAGKYNFSDNREVPGFTYQNPDFPALVTLRTSLKLDSIAGGGNEISRMINLVHWIHNLVPHDGEHGNPEVKNAMNMIAECKREKKGLNCRGLATVLNECYLSLGFKSRFVTCMPKDSVFSDCHVINMVWSEEWRKWIWIDPTNDAYVMNEKGELLSIPEVRERLISGKQLILNPDANWNHRSSAVKEEYLYNYMAKNLYRFECAVSSEYDTETKTIGKKIDYVELLPLDGYNQLPQKAEQTGKSSGIKFINYKTNNPSLFWAAPK
ncbi:MAG: transglutaminase domain-containing protein [Bacteroidales bacterium]